MAQEHRVDVQADLVFEAPEPTTLALQIAVAGSVEIDAESLEVQPAGTPVQLVELSPGNRAHVVEVAPGRLTVSYAARVAAGPTNRPDEPTAADRLVALRQSRYCPSDEVEGFVAAELGHLRGSPTAALEIGRWAHERLVYEGGSSGPSDTALDTVLHGRGVCRDFAHVTVMLCRALGIPARFVAAYAPGLAPMDFHAVAEVAGPHGWEVVDATRLAPRPSLVRIATGRDAADTALVTTVTGYADLLESSVLAVVHGVLPHDDHASRVSIR